MTNQEQTIITPPNIGDHWESQGGLFAAKLRDPNNGQQYHLIMHDQALEKSTWGKYGESAVGATNFWDGESNTRVLKALNYDDSMLAELDKLNQSSDHQDWYIPAQAELNILALNLRDKCEPCWHWSSTQYSADFAWGQDFSDGLQDVDSKDYKLAARAVRRVSVIHQFNQPNQRPADDQIDFG